METREYHIHLILPESDRNAFTPTEFVDAFKARWGTTIACEPSPQLGGGANTDVFLAGDGARKVRLVIERKKLPAELVELLNSAVFSLSEEQADALSRHVGAIRLDYLFGDTPARERVEICAEMLLSLGELRGIIGIVNAAAQSYLPIERVSTDLRSATTLHPDDLCRLFIGSQAVGSDNSFSIHSHGMEQFSLPNFEIPFPPGTELADAFPLMNGLISEVVAAQESPPVGDQYTFEGLRRTYKVSAPRDDPDHPTGLVFLE
jgi:hypothetical protein